MRNFPDCVRSRELTVANRRMRQAIEQYKTNDWMWLAVAPEGTRRRTDHLKSGFYRIALGAGVPEGCVALFRTPVEAAALALEQAEQGDLLVFLALTQRGEVLELVHEFLDRR